MLHLCLQALSVIMIYEMLQSEILFLISSTLVASTTKSIIEEKKNELHTSVFL